MADFSSSKTLIVTRHRERSPHWYGIPVRVFLLTLIGTLLSFTSILLLAIVGTVVLSALRGIHPDMTIAYRHIALPMALVVGAIIFVLTTVLEVRHYQQRKALRAIERMG